jgi:SAM-dependent methyltransferase
MSVDRFGPVAGHYAAHRPHYPPELYAWLAAQCRRPDCAWDCGAGSGQATAALAKHFRHVIATDISAAQLALAPRLANVEYRVAAAEDPGLAADSADLVAVAQAMHWFDLPRFHAQVRRVLRPHGVVAAWSYGVPTIGEPALHAIFRHFHDHVVGPWWPAERHRVGAGYLDAPFPYHRIEPPAFPMRSAWPLRTLLGYMRSWSASVAFIKAHGRDPVDDVEAPLRQAWGDPERSVSIDWPLTVLAGSV